MRYPEFLKALRLVESFDKLAASEDLPTAQQAQTLRAAVCDDLITQLKLGSESLVKAALDLREQHVRSGEKVAAASDAAAEFVGKLASADFVDGVLSAELSKTAGDDAMNARATQLLGREYAVHLLRGLFA